MSYKVIAQLPPSSREFSGRAAIVGVGESDYSRDYQTQRSPPPGYDPPTFESLSKAAFEQALADSGLERRDIDGLSVSATFGGPEDPRDLARKLGLSPRYCVANGNIMAGPLPVVCADITAGKADTVAMIFSILPHSMGRQFGGATDQTGPVSYYYYHPWGWSSQAAHWALMFSCYQATYGAREADLGAVAVQVRQHARATSNAVMRQAMTIDDYMASRYVVRPLRVFDICMVNDGAVCLIVTRREIARGAPRKPVLVSGWGEAKVSSNKMHAMVRERLRVQMQEAGRQALDMAGLSLGDIGHFEGYDAGTIHLVNQVEGYGFAEPGTGIEFCKAGQMTLGGRLPTNTSGGNLSGSYMQGWSQVVEVVRQLRHDADARQVQGIGASMSSLVQTDQAHPLIFTRQD